MGKKLQQRSISIDLGQQVDYARLAKGWTMEKVADTCGVHRSQVSRIVAGDFKTLSKNVQKICTVLQIDPHMAFASGDPVRAELVAAVEAGFIRAGRKRLAYAEAVIAVTKLFAG